jgi:hypothetical protein
MKEQIIKLIEECSMPHVDTMLSGNMLSIDVSAECATRGEIGYLHDMLEEYGINSIDSDMYFSSEHGIAIKIIR